MKTNNEITLRSFGAAQTVSGSKHLIQTPELNILLDCGLFYGKKELRMKNREELPLPANEIDVVILTHAHLDHCGYLPLLVKNGFKGNIYMTPPTRELTQLILLDNAKIQEEDAEKANHFGYTKHKPALPLYTVKDAEASFARFVPVNHTISVTLSRNISFELRKAGTVLGAAAVVLHCFGKTIIFSGNVGHSQSSFFFPPDSLPPADIVIMETTYGDCLHDAADPMEQLSAIIHEALLMDGTILIPGFAISKVMELMHLINHLKKQNRIPYWLPVFLDSTIMGYITDILYHYPKWHKLTQQECRSICRDVVINRDHNQTKNILSYRGEFSNTKIIISDSNMFTSGRALEYLKHLITHENNIILLPDHQAEETRGRDLKNGNREIKIHGHHYRVKAKVVEMTALSCHADQTGLLEWLKPLVPFNPKVILIHGEPPAQRHFAEKLNHKWNLDVLISTQNQSISLFKINQYEPV